jgi:AsmA protein
MCALKQPMRLNMVKKVLIGVGVLVLLLVAGLFFWARSILATETVRTAIAAQVSDAVGQPVTIGGIGATIFPRVTVNLDNVAIGAPPKITVATLHVGASVGALLSRRIEHGALRLSGAKIELPLPAFGFPSSAPPSAEPAGDTGSRVIELVSIDEIVLSDVEIVSGGRTLRGDIEAALQGQGIVLRKVELAAADTTISASGQVTDLNAPAGELNIKAGTLNLDQLIAFASDFASASGQTQTPATQRASLTQAPAARRPASAAKPSSTMNIVLSLDADRASMGGLTMDKLTGRARLTPQSIVVEPIGFGLFGGRYDGTLTVDVSGNAPAFRWNAALTGVDVAAATAFAGSPNTVSGRMSGKIDLAGRGADAATAIKTARGNLRVDIVDGVVKKLGLVRNVVVATSMRDGAMKQAASGGSTDEPFTRLGATLAIANGAATTNDLVFESKDLLLAAVGSVRLDATAVNLSGNVQLSEELSKQSGNDLQRYAGDNGRVTLPATISGPADNLSVKIDVASMARRAITNRANEEAQKRLKTGLGGLLRRP